MEEMITAKGIYKKEVFPTVQPIFLLHDINITMYKGEFAAITGRSGSGKSTLLDILLGYEKEAVGTVVLGDIDIGELDEAELQSFRSENIGVCIEGITQIDLYSTVRENICNRLNLMKKENLHIEAENILRTFNLMSAADQPVKAGSLYDNYRLMLAVAFCGLPPIVVIDEILDYFPEHDRKELLSVIISLKEKYNITILIVTHELEIIKGSDRAFFIKEGTLYKVDLNRLRTVQ